VSFFVRCEWFPPAGAEIQARIGQIARLLGREETVAVVGGHWYRKGRSKKEALSKPISLAKLEEGRSWDREKFVFEETGREMMDYWFGAWNGRDDPDSVSLLVHLTEPSTEMDSIGFGGPGLESLKDKWRHVLAWGEAVAHHLGGRSLVSSNELMEWAEAEGLEGADMAGYAAFDGRDGRSIVGVATWPEAITPDKKRVQEFIGMHRAMVGK